MSCSKGFEWLLLHSQASSIHSLDLGPWELLGQACELSDRCPTILVTPPEATNAIHPQGSQCGESQSCFSPHPCFSPLVGLMGIPSHFK